VLVRDTRPDKLHEISTADVRRQQVERISSEERRSLADFREHALKRSQTVGVEILQSSSSLQHAEDHLFERKTVAKDHELLTEALRHGRGSVDLNELRGTYELEVSRGKLLHVGGNVATEHSLERERSMVAAVDRGIGRYAALEGEEKLSLSVGLREEQRRAVEAILEFRDLAINLRGAAGTGKTATRASRLPKGSFPLLREALLAGEFERGLAPSLTGYKERMARTVVSKLLDAGLLVSPSHRAKVRRGLPLAVVERCFPALYPATSYTHS
jgi:hypothetical protein